METFFIADTHFYHKKCIDYDNRPFKDVKEMNKKLFYNWNRIVKKNDHIYILGDFCFGSSGMTYDMLSILNGHKTMIMGNHDKNINERIKAYIFKHRVYDIKEINIEGLKLIICHYPLLSWNGMQKGTVHLHGHQHIGVDPVPNINRINICCNRWNYSPVSVKQIKDFIEDRLKNNSIDLLEGKK